MEKLLNYSRDDVKGIVCEIVDKALAHGNTGVSVTFMGNGDVYVNAYPYNPDDSDDGDI